MKRTGFPRAVLAVVAAAILLADLVVMAPPAAAQVAPANAALGLFRVINAINRRNRIYQAARDTQRDFNAYYSSLQNTARAQLVSGELNSLRQGETGLETVRAAAYIRMTAALAAEQAAITRAIDAETKQARRDFNRTLVRQLQEVVIRLPGAQQILGEVRSLISNIRSTVIALQTAAASNQPLDVLTQRLAEQVSSSEIVQDRVRNLGSMLGPDLDRGLGGALTQVNNTIQDINREANQAVELLDGMDAQVAALDLSRAEVAEGGATVGPLNIRLTDRATAVLDVASQGLAFLSAMQGTGGTTREQMYQQIRTDLLQERNAQLLNAAQHVSQVVCTGVGRGDYEVAVGMLGKSPDTAADPEKATYMVCSDRDTGQPVRAWIVRVVMPTPTPGTGTQPSEATAAMEPGNLPLEQCNATAFLTVSIPDLGWDENDCACSYHITLSNNHPEYALIAFSRISSHLEDASEGSQWFLHADAVIGPGPSLEDGGTGWGVVRWGGFYSTCQMRDGELTFPVHFSTDRIGAILAIDGCKWIQDASPLESISEVLPNSCEGE